MKEAKKILLVEDDSKISSDIHTFLCDLGYLVDIADGGQKAVRMLINSPKPYDLILSDYDMPEKKELNEIKGIDLLKELDETIKSKITGVLDQITGLELFVLIKNPDNFAATVKKYCNSPISDFIDSEYTAFVEKYKETKLILMTSKPEKLYSSTHLRALNDFDFIKKDGGLTILKKGQKSPYIEEKLLAKTIQKYIG